MHVDELIVQRGVRNRGKMKNGVESGSCRIAELFSPIQRCQILRDEIAAVLGEIFEITRAKIIDHGKAGVREFFLQRKREIRSDETGATSDDEVWKRVQFW